MVTTKEMDNEWEVLEDDLLLSTDANETTEDENKSLIAPPREDYSISSGSTPPPASTSPNLEDRTRKEMDPSKECDGIHSSGVFSESSFFRKEEDISSDTTNLSVDAATLSKKSECENEHMHVALGSAGCTTSNAPSNNDEEVKIVYPQNNTSSKDIQKVEVKRLNSTAEENQECSRATNFQKGAGVTTFQEKMKRFSTFFNTTVHDIDDKIKITEKAKFVGESIGKEASKIGTNTQSMRETIGAQSERVSRSVSQGVTKMGNNVAVMGQTIGREIKDAYVENDINGKSRDVIRKAKTAARTTGTKVKEFDEKYHVLDHLIKAGVVVGAVALASGNARAGATAMAVAGTAFVASENMRPQNDFYAQRVHLD